MLICSFYAVLVFSEYIILVFILFLKIIFICCVVLKFNFTSTKCLLKCQIDTLKWQSTTLSLFTKIVLLAVCNV